MIRPMYLPKPRAGGNLERLRKLRRRVGYTRALWAGEIAVMEARLYARVIHADGSVTIPKGIGPNGLLSRKKVTGEFVTDIVANMVTETSAFGDYKYHDSGTGTTAEANTDGDLVTPAGPTTRATGTQVAGGTATAPTYTSVGTIAYTSTLAITEHAIFNTAARATTAILDRSVFTAVNVVNGDSIEFTYVLTINAEA